MKTQESEIIAGLKNAVCTLTSLLKDKEDSYADLQNNYEKLNTVLLEKLTLPQENQRPERDVPKRLDQRPLRENLLT